ncbi:hypothetical protein BG003_011615 [Podila horticola]|nr:hypothetical protein BG003_011615 [Podila horticola]
MADHSNVTLAPNGCPLETHPVDPTRLFSKDGLNLDLPRIGWIGSGICAFVASVISFVLIWRHLQYYTKPNQQRYIVRMLLMVPIYAISSWFSFVYVREAIYYETIRSLYEAFVIASFLILMLQYLGDSLEDQKRVLRQHKKTERWFFPLCCLKYNPSRPHFLQFMKWGILQYVPLVVVATILTIVLQYYGWYCESSWNPKFGHAWILVINTTAVTVATYFLIMFYFTIREDLKEYEPFYKFMAVKLVVFFSFWQMVLIEGLVYFGYIHETTYWSTTDISVGICAVLIDVEMVFFSLMHMKAFTYKPYVPLIPNPAYVPPEGESSTIDAESSIDGNSKTGPSSYRRNSLRRNPSFSSLSSEQEHPKRKSKASSKKSEKSKEPSEPKMILDYTQKTPVWKGLLDSFNPLDTLRELKYGFIYLYRWSRGIPVDKDSRRLLDLEVAFGRLRPEVPYTPSKDKKKDKDNKKKDKKKKKGNDTNSDDHDSTEDSDDKEDDNDKDNLRKNRDLEKAAGGVEYHAGVGNSRSQDSLRNPRAQSKRAIDVELGYGAGVDTLPMHSMRESTVPRKPIRSVTGAGPKKSGPLGSKKSSREYLGKEDATHTERATLPDIKLDPIPKKILLSGLYEDIPLPSDQTISSTSSLDIPMPSAMPSAGTYRPTSFGNDPRQTRERALEQEPFIPDSRLRQEYNRPAEPSSSRPNRGGNGGLTQLSNRNFDTKTVPYQQDFVDTVEPSDTESVMADSRNPRFGDNPRLHHQVSRDDSIQSSVVSGFYHNREGSRSDPELGRYGLDHEHYLEQMRFLAEEEEAARFKLHQRELEGEEKNPDPKQSNGDQKSADASQLPSNAQQKVQQPRPSSSRYLDVTEEQDPVIAEYNQLQYQQQQQQRQRQQQEQQRHYQQPSSGRQQPPRRRNSLESLDSDYSVGYRPEYRYDRNYNPVLVEPSSRPRYAHQQQPQQERYQRAYRYPTGMSQPAAPPQVYRFPDERDYLPPPRRDGYSGRGPPAAVSVAMRTQQYSRPYDDYSRSSQSYYPQPQYSYVQQARMDRSRGGTESPRYTSPPPQQGPSSSARRGPDREREWDRGGYRDQEPGPDQLFPASRYAAPFLRDYEYQQRETRRRMTQSPPIRHDSPGDRMGGRQQDPDRRTGPRNDGVMGSRERSPPPVPQHVAPKARRPGPNYGNPLISAAGPGFPPKAALAGDAGGRPRVYEDDGPYEEAVVWTRPPQ